MKPFGFHASKAIKIKNALCLLFDLPGSLICIAGCDFCTDITDAAEAAIESVTDNL